MEKGWMLYREFKDGRVEIEDNITYRKARKLYNEIHENMESLGLAKVGFSEINCDVLSQQILRKKAGLATSSIS